jgi:hypothetical protein
LLAGRSRAILRAVDDAPGGTLDLTRVRAHLERLEYRIELRHAAWWECRVTGSGEEWFGRGDDEQAALRRALELMFPSHAARAALASLLEQRSAETRPEATRSEAPASEHPPPLEPAADRPPPSRPPPPAAPPPESRPSLLLRQAQPPEEILRDLEELRERVLWIESDMAVMAPRLQRLHILGFAAQVRALQEGAPGVRAIEGAGGSVIAILARMARTFWPGTVRALARAATPRECIEDVRTRNRPPPRSWREVAELAAEAIEGIVSDPRGADEYGWFDASRLDPPPPDPDGMLRSVAQVCTRSEQLLDETGSGEAADSELASTLADAARRIRWLRAHVGDDVAWGTTIGTLRRTLANHPAGLEAVSTLLEPVYCPTQPWAYVIGYDPEKRKRQRLRRQVLTSVPASSAAGELIASWIVLAIDAGLTTAEIVERLAPQRDRAEALLGLEPPASADRRVRTRFRRALALLSNGGDEVVAEEVDLDEAAPGEPGDLPPVHPLVARVRQAVNGRRALFVSNREDPALRERIEDSFGLAITWCVGDPRRIDAHTQRIRHGAYDLVLSATGFQSHSVDRVLAEACRAASVRLVRVDHGRPLACARALAREYGIGADHRTASATG